MARVSIHVPVVGIWLLLVGAASSHADTIYKSFDANGHVVYSDHVDPSLTQTTIVHLEDRPHAPQAAEAPDVRHVSTGDGDPATGDLAAGEPAAGEPAADVAVNTDLPPPPPQDEQPPAAVEDGVIWTPGYWRWGGRGYSWVRGAWVRPPAAGVQWNPPRWDRTGAGFVLHPGHWRGHTAVEPVPAVTPRPGASVRGGRPGTFAPPAGNRGRPQRRPPPTP